MMTTMMTMTMTKRLYLVLRELASLGCMTYAMAGAYGEVGCMVPEIATD